MDDFSVDRQDGVATVSLSGGNRFDLVSLRRLTNVLQPLVNDPDVSILILRSTNPAGFCSGWMPYSHAPTDAESLTLASAGQKLAALLTDADCVTVADIHGDCLGPGLELALACDYRIAEATPLSRIGFPDATAGLMPAWGGVDRLVRLLGATAAVRWLTNPIVLNAREAQSCGLIDRTFCERRARIERRTIVDWLIRKSRKATGPNWLRRRRSASKLSRLIPSRETPFSLTVQSLVNSATRSSAEGRAAERTWFARSRSSPTVMAHVALEQSAHAEPRLPSHPRLPIPPFPHVIALDSADPAFARFAALASLRGSQLIVTPESIEPLHLSLKTILRRGLATSVEVDQVQKRIHHTDDESGMERAEWLLVSPEQVEGLEPFLSPRCLVAVASELVESFQTNAARPCRIIGLRQESQWQSPGTIPLVEVAMGPESSADAAATAVKWLRQLGHQVVVGSERNGLTVRRVLAAYFDEAIRLTAEGISPLALDAAVRASGSTEGPFERMDRIGFEALVGGVRKLIPLMAAGMTGQNQGFYRRGILGRVKENVSAQLLLWDSRMQAVDAIHQSPAAVDLLPPKQQLVVAIERLGLRTLNEAVSCLFEDGIAGAAEIDLAITRGAGLLAGHGGPLRHADTVGSKTMAIRMMAVAKLYGSRFQPHPDWIRRAKAGETFYDNTPEAELVYRRLRAA